jgi:hypothetical protein
MVPQKPQAKRRAILLEISPRIPRIHAPEVQAFKDAGYSDKLQNQREDFLLPFANLEDLCSEGGTKCTLQCLDFPYLAYKTVLNLVLSLLHFRALHFPSAFAQFDHDTVRFLSLCTSQ